MAIYRSETTTIDLYDVYLPHEVRQSLSIEDALIHHTYCRDQWYLNDKDLYAVHRDEVRMLEDLIDNDHEDLEHIVNSMNV
jgi:hypothetical protein